MTRGECRRNVLFVALRGEKSDGHQFVDQAIEKGRVGDRGGTRKFRRRAPPASWSRTRRSALADLGAAFYGMPARKLKMAGGHRHQWQDDHDIPHQAHLRKSRDALRTARHRPI